MRPRPAVRRCVACGRPVLGLTGESVTVQPYLADHWPGSRAELDALVGDWHVACLRAGGHDPAWTECLRRWATTTAGGRQLLAEPGIVVVRLPGTWLVVTRGADVTLTPAQQAAAQGPSLTLRNDAFTFDLFGQPPDRLAAVAAAVTGAGRVAIGELAPLLDAPWYDDRAPVVDATVTAAPDTVERLRTTSVLAAVADVRLELPPAVAAVLA